MKPNSMFKEVFHVSDFAQLKGQRLANSQILYVYITLVVNRNEKNILGIFCNPPPSIRLEFF